jgi:hypothetical protein
LRAQSKVKKDLLVSVASNKKGINIIPKTNKDLMIKLVSSIAIKMMKLTDIDLLLNLQKLFCRDCHYIDKVNDSDCQPFLDICH